MEPNNFIGIEDQDDKNEIIEIIQHFWFVSLRKNILNQNYL